MKRFPAVLLCGIAAMLLTVVLYFTILGNVLLEAIHFVALVAILLAEGITTAYAYAAKGSPRKVAATVVSSFMIPYALILSVVYIVNFPTGYGTYLGLYFAGTVIINVIAFILMSFDARKNDEDHRMQEAKNNMLGLRKIVKCILADPAAQPYAAQLRALEEKLHFSNDNVLATEDENIRLLLLQLQTNISDPQFDSEQMLVEIGKAIAIRNATASKKA